MKILDAIIIDDEPDSIKLLKMQLQQHCPWINIVSCFTNAINAVPEIEVLQPNLLFLDIEMPGLNGFELLERLLHHEFGIIFITAYSQFALKAFRYNALDYLVKPIETNDLIKVVKKAEKLPKPGSEQVSMLQKQLREEHISKIAVPSQSGISFINLNDIIYAESSNNYTILMLQDQSKFIVSKTLKDVQEVLEEHYFMRVHRQYIINLNHVIHFNRTESILTMVNKCYIPVARHQKEKLIAKYGWL